MHWLETNWFSLLQTVSIIGTLSIATIAVRSSGRATKGSNTLAIASSNRQIWGQLITNPVLQSVTRHTMMPGEEVRYDELRFVLQVIHHIETSFELAQTGGIKPVQNMRRDIHATMTLPVFRVVWQDAKAYQDNSFVEFIDSCISGADLDLSVGRRPSVIRKKAKDVTGSVIKHLSIGAGSR
jgi:hypothetical protein